MNNLSQDTQLYRAVATTLNNLQFSYGTWIITKTISFVGNNMLGYENIIDIYESKYINMMPMLGLMDF